MLRFLIINGPNLNLLGIREPDIYGNKTYTELCDYITASAKTLGVQVTVFQSNHEGALIDKIGKAYKKFDGIIINAAAFTHTSIAIMDALKAVNLPTVEVHLSDTSTRESFRKKSYISLVAIKVFKGEGFAGYTNAIAFLKGKLS